MFGVSITNLTCTTPNSYNLLLALKETISVLQDCRFCDPAALLRNNRKMSNNAIAYTHSSAIAGNSSRVKRKKHRQVSRQTAIILHMSSRFFSHFQWSSFSAKAAVPYTVGTSPGLRSTFLAVTLFPDAFSNAETISRTEYPRPVPRLYTFGNRKIKYFQAHESVYRTMHSLTLYPKCCWNIFKAATWPLAKSTTCI